MLAVALANYPKNQQNLVAIVLSLMLLTLVVNVLPLNNSLERGIMSLMWSRTHFRLLCASWPGLVLVIFF